MMYPFFVKGYERTNNVKGEELRGYWLLFNK